MSDSGYVGDMTPHDWGDDYAALVFTMHQVMSRASHVALVRVVAVNSPGGVAPAGTVDVQPLVNMINGLNQQTPHGLLYGLPYARIQGGARAIIIDPVVGDMGVALFCDRDISSVKANQAQSNPGSRRRFDMADGLYLGGYLNAAPTSYVMMNDDGITIVDPTQITLQAPTITMTADAGQILANDVPLDTHTHGGVQSGSSDTDPPNT